MNPATGTFTTMDAYQGSTCDPMSLHKYLFTNANPVMYSDPSGYSPLVQQGTAITMMTVLENAMVNGCIFAAAYSVSIIYQVVTGKGTMTFDQFAFGLGQAFVSGLFIGIVACMSNAILASYITSVGLGIVFSSVSFTLSKAADIAADYFYANGNYFWASFMSIVSEVLFILGFSSALLGLSTLFTNSNQPGNNKTKGNGGTAGGTVTESQNKKFALGISDYLDDFARANGAETYKNYDPVTWRKTVLEKLADPNTEVFVNLDGVDSPWAAVQRVASGAGSATATDWELFQIYSNPDWWGSIKWYKNGLEVTNPFL